MTVFLNKTLLITGGTGSFGNAVLKRFLDSDIGEIRIFSRDEKKQDDMREAPSRTLIEALWAAGARVQAFDPVAMEETRRIYGERDDFTLAANKYAALEGADALAICTEWQQFRAPDFDEMQSRLTARVIVDGRNLFHPDRLRADGWSYYSVGRA